MRRAAGESSAGASARRIASRFPWPNAATQVSRPRASSGTVIVIRRDGGFGAVVSTALVGVASSTSGRSGKIEAT
jgi:hypothetical protein